MWSLKPINTPYSTCPRCQHQNEGFGDYLFVASQVMGEGKCAQCDLQYFHNWPVGHGIDFPMAFANGTASLPERSHEWLTEPVMAAIKGNKMVDAEIAREVRFEVEQAILLNCLDSCYGHVILKILNSWSFRELEFPKGLIVMVPENCVWMVPEFVAEIWSVQTPLKHLNAQLPSLKIFIEQVSNNFESIHLAPVNTHPDHQEIDFSKYFREKPFNINHFDSRKYQLCIVWREDRWWTRTWLGEIIGFLSIKYSVNWLKVWLIDRQLAFYKKLIKLVRKELPDLSIQVVGMGIRGSFPDHVVDQRRLSPKVEDELIWSHIYASSQVVVGVHGSNMLIPTALAAGFVALLPNHKIPHLAEDILMQHTPRFQTFLGRHLSVLSSPSLVSKHIVSMFRDFSYLHKHTVSRS